MMSKLKTALFIGRFQPFHNGHLKVVEKILSDEDIAKVIIGIGSSQLSNNLHDPFTIRQRALMISQSIRTKKDIEIVPIPDFDDDEKWMNYILVTLPKIDLVYSGNEWVRKLFFKKGY